MIIQNTLFRCRGIAILLVTMFCLGCVGEKNSLHEMDHELPAHWPTSMQDAAEKIEARLGQIRIQDAQAKLREELTDLVEWAPEVAADTDLREPEWIPIYKLCETLRHHLNAKDITLSDCRDDLERLTTLLRESHAKLPTTNSLQDSE